MSKIQTKAIANLLQTLTEEEHVALLNMVSQTTRRHLQRAVTLTLASPAEAASVEYLARNANATLCRKL